MVQLGRLDKSLVKVTAVAELETVRLRLRPLEESDLEAYQEMVYGSADVMRYMLADPRTIEQTAKTLRYFIDQWQTEGRSRAWAVIHKGENRLIGHAGYTPIFKADPPTDETEVFYAVAKPYWGQGLVTELVRPILDYGFRVLKLPRIAGLAVPENIASRRVMEKNGMTFLGITHRYYDSELAYYELYPPQENHD